MQMHLIQRPKFLFNMPILSANKILIHKPNNDVPLFSFHSFISLCRLHISKKAFYQILKFKKNSKLCWRCTLKHNFNKFKYGFVYKLKSFCKFNKKICT